MVDKRGLGLAKMGHTKITVIIRHCYTLLDRSLSVRGSDKSASAFINLCMSPESEVRSVVLCWNVCLFPYFLFLL